MCCQWHGKDNCGNGKHGVVQYAISSLGTGEGIFWYRGIQSWGALLFQRFLPLWSVPLIFIEIHY
jgi:hypothetical protein